ncbi:hypothetical protein PR001_g16161 [Phytophthora rubi]|uniref:BED-type domain-containing protein n=1 Tax=Phytophthora rubi TaxID=129364 RepID=A0A6A3KY54_9STRA|nr:hypothetical protein PR001_g16161 [Phytophthora rubi]
MTSLMEFLTLHSRQLKSTGQKLRTPRAPASPTFAGSQLHLRRTTMTSNKQLTAFFYAPLGQGLFRCNICGSERKQVVQSGYSNLLAHLAGKHEGYETQYAAFQNNSARPLQAFGFVPEESSHLF